MLTILNFAATSIDLDPSINKYIDILVANEIEVKNLINQNYYSFLNFSFNKKKKG